MKEKSQTRQQNQTGADEKLFFIPCILLKILNVRLIL